MVGSGKHHDRDVYGRARRDHCGCRVIENYVDVWSTGRQSRMGGHRVHAGLRRTAPDFRMDCRSLRIQEDIFFGPGAVYVRLISLRAGVE